MALVEDDIQNLRSEVETLKAENEGLQLEVAHNQQHSSSLEGDYQQKIAKLQQQVKEQAASVERSLSTCEDLTKEVEETKQVIAMLEGSLRDQQRIHRTESQEFKTFQARFFQLESEKDSLLAQLDTIYKDMTARLTEIKDLKKQSTDSEAKLASAADKTKQLEKALAQEKDRTLHAEREAEKQETLIVSLKQRFALAGFWLFLLPW